MKRTYIPTLAFALLCVVMQADAAAVITTSRWSTETPL